MRILSSTVVVLVCLSIVPACGGDGKKADAKKEQKANPFDPASRMDANMTESEKKEVKEANKILSGE